MNALAEQVYAAYPKKVAKPKAMTAIVKAIKEFGFDFILERTKAYATARSNQDHQYTPYPATWFNQQRFNDDPSTWATIAKVSNGAEMILRSKELDRVEAELSSIRSSVDSHRDLDPEQWRRVKLLRARRDELKQMLGWVL